jgi:integrase
MASVYKLPNGKWRATVRVKGHKEVTKQKNTRAAAAVWAADKEKELRGGVAASGEKSTISVLISKFRALRKRGRPIIEKSTEDYTLKILDRSIGDLVAADLTVEDIQGWALKRSDEGAGGYKIGCDLSKLATVLRVTLPRSVFVLDEARPKLAYIGLIEGANTRDRRPTAEESVKIKAWMEQFYGHRYRDFVAFGELTAMRRAEIAGLLWSDIDEAQKMVLVRDRKDPKHKIGNHQWVPLLAGSFDLMIAQPRVDERIFPIAPKYITKAFTECRKALGLEDIVFHDMRHEGISQMFEHGYDIPKVSIVSGHKDWKNLKKYTNIKPQSLHEHDTRQGTPPHPDKPPTA